MRLITSTDELEQQIGVLAGVRQIPAPSTGNKSGAACGALPNHCPAPLGTQQVQGGDEQDGVPLNQGPSWWPSGHQDGIKRQFVKTGCKEIEPRSKAKKCASSQPFTPGHA